MQSTLGNSKSIKTAHWAVLRGYWLVSCAGVFVKTVHRFVVFLFYCCLVIDDIELLEDILEVDHLLSWFCAVLHTKQKKNVKPPFYLDIFFKPSF